MSDCTPTPYFPQDLENYAPWVARDGLLAEYGKCQCGCHQSVHLAPRSSSKLGWKKGKPVKYLEFHHLKSRPDTPMAVRFWSKVNVGSPSECWFWTASTYTNGYGQFWTGTNLTPAHRYAYFLVNGEIPDGLLIRHRCDQVRCCNPAHLEIGTQLDNMRDMLDRKRGNPTKGENQHFAKLTEEDVRFIRESFANNQYSRKELSEMFSVCRPHIHCILTRKVWKHI